MEGGVSVRYGLLATASCLGSVPPAADDYSAAATQEPSAAAAAASPTANSASACTTAVAVEASEFHRVVAFGRRRHYLIAARCDECSLATVSTPVFSLAGGGGGAANGREAQLVEAGVSEELVSSWVWSPMLEVCGCGGRRVTNGDGIIPLKACKMRTNS
jgi:hypothetical protein